MSNLISQALSPDTDGGIYSILLDYLSGYLENLRSSNSSSSEPKINFSDWLSSRISHVTVSLIIIAIISLVLVGFWITWSVVKRIYGCCSCCRVCDSCRCCSGKSCSTCSRCDCCDCCECCESVEQLYDADSFGDLKKNHSAETFSNLAFNGNLNENSNGALNGNSYGTLNGKTNGTLNGNANGNQNEESNGTLNGNLIEQKSARRTKRLEMICFIVFLILTLTVGAMLITSTAFSAQMVRFLDPSDRNSSDSNSNSITGVVSSAVTDLTFFIENTITETNNTVLKEAYAEKQHLLEIFARLAKEYLDKLSEDLDFTQLINTIDKFLATVKTLLNGMNQIKAARDNEIAELLRFASNFEQLKGQLESRLNSVCTSSASFAFRDKCVSATAALQAINIGLDYRKINSDSSVTIVTLLDRFLKLNITEVEIQVGGAKSMLTDGLALIEKEVSSLIDSLIGIVSSAFDSALASVQGFVRSARSFSSSHEFQSALSTSNSVLFTFLALSTFLTCIVIVLFFAVILPIMFKYVREKFRSDRTDRYKVVSNICTKPGRRTCFVLALLFVLLFLTGYFLIFLGAVVESDACRYLQQPQATQVVDDKMNEIVKTEAWPLLQEFLKKNEVPINLRDDMAPQNITSALLHQCSNQSLTVFEVFHLNKVLDATTALQSAAVMNELKTGERMVRDMIVGLNADTIIPPDFDSILATLPDFAAVIDSEDFGPSIAELRKPLLQNSDSVNELTQTLNSIADEVQSFMSSESVLLRHFSSELQKLSQVHSVNIANLMSNLRVHFETLQANRIIGQLTANLSRDVAQMKTTLSNTPFALSAVSNRFLEVIAKYIPIFAKRLNPLIERILNSIGHCYPLNQILVKVQSSCSTDVANVGLSGVLFMISSSIALVLLLLVAVVFLQLVEERKVEHRNQERPWVILEESFVAPKADDSNNGGRYRLGESDI